MESYWHTLCFTYRQKINSNGRNNKIQREVKMKKLLFRTAVFSFLLLFLAGPASATLILPGSETSLQNVLNNITVGPVAGASPAHPPPGRLGLPHSSMLRNPVFTQNVPASRHRLTLWTGRHLGHRAGRSVNGRSTESDQG